MLTGSSRTWKTSTVTSLVCGEGFLTQRRNGAKPAGLQAASFAALLCAFAALREKYCVDPAKTRIITRNITISTLSDHRFMLAFPIRLRLAGDARRVLPVPASHT